jgi:hypothetical protein
LALLTLLTHLKVGQATNSSNSAHYTEGVTIPGTSIKAVRFQPGDSEQRWWYINNQNGGFADWDEADIAFTGILHLASGPPASGGDTVLDFKDASGTNSKLSLYAQDDGTLILLDRAYTGFITGTETPDLEGGTYFIQIVAGTGATAALRFKVFALDTLEEVFDSGALTANLGANNYARVYLGRTTTFNTSPMDIYWGPVGVASGTTAVPAGFRGGHLDPDDDTTNDGWLFETDETPSDDDLNTYASVSDADSEIGFSVESLTAAGVSAESILGVRVFARMDSEESNDGTVQLKITSGESSASTSTFTIATQNEAYSLVRDTDPATSAAWTPAALGSVQIGVLSVDPGTSETRLAELSLEFLYIPAAAADGVRMGNPNHPSTRAMLRLMGVAV